MAKTIGRGKDRQKGSAAITLISWLPLFLTLTASLSLVSFALVIRVKANRICFEAVVNLQRDLRERLIQLEKLNTRARSLRRQRTAAESELKAAMASAQPPLIAAAQAHRLYVIAMQLELKRRQTTLFQQAHQLRLDARRQTEMDLRRIGGKLLGSRPNLPTPLAMRPSPAWDLSPDYVPLPNFKIFQAENLNYQVPLFQGVPQWILKNIPVPTNQTAECGATLNPGDWTLALSMARP